MHCRGNEKPALTRAGLAIRLAKIAFSIVLRRVSVESDVVLWNAKLFEHIARVVGFSWCLIDETCIPARENYPNISISAR